MYGSLAEHREVPGTSVEVLKKLTEVPGRCTNAVPVPYPHPIIFTRAYPYPGYCATGVQNLQEFRARVMPRVLFCTYPTEHNVFTHRSSGYVYNGSLAELTEVPGRYTNVVPVPVAVPGNC